MEQPTVSVILPTFREADNIPALIPRLATALAAPGCTFEIIIVDDDSRDGIDRAVHRLAPDYPVTLVIRTTEKGLSSAVLEGFRRARGRVLLVMDADLSHPPEIAPQLVARILEGCEFALGSRFVPGGHIPEFTLPRRLNASLARILARPLTSVRDPLSGFFAIPAQLLDRTSRLDPIGWKIGLEILVRCQPRKTAEIPITFAPRRHGQSKLTLTQRLIYLQHLTSLYRTRFLSPRRRMHEKA